MVPGLREEELGKGSLGHPRTSLLPAGHVEKLETTLVAALVVECLGRTKGQEVDSEGSWAGGCWERPAQLVRQTHKACR